VTGSIPDPPVDDVVETRDGSGMTARVEGSSERWLWSDVVVSLDKVE
jgi:hypothetical protein